MPQTPSPIPSVSSRPAASQAVAKTPSQPSSEDQATTFASLLGVETRTKAGAASRKRSASSAAKAKDGLPASSQDASSESGAGNQPNPGQLIPASVLTDPVSSYISMSSADRSVSAISVSASGAWPYGTQSILPTASASAEDTGVDSASDRKLPNSAVLVRSETHFAPEAPNPAATAGNALPSQTATSSPSNQAGAAGQADPATLQQQPATPNADPQTAIQANLTPEAVASSQPESPQPVASGAAGQADLATLQQQFTSQPAASSTDPSTAIQAKITPEAVASSQQASPQQVASGAAGQADLATLQRQFTSQPATSNAAPSTAAPGAIASSQPESPQPVAFMRPRTQASAQPAQQPDTPQDGSSSADAPAESPTSGVPNLGSSVAASTGRGATSDGSTKDPASHRDQNSSPTAAAPAQAQQTFEASASIAPGAGSASPAQQIFDGIQRAVSSSTDGQSGTDTVQTTLEGQQPLKTITLALSPQNLGNVAVELSLKSGKLAIKLQVEEPGTMQLLRQDGALGKLLESAGYSVQNVSIQLAPQTSQLAQTAQAAPNAQNFSGQLNSDGSGQQQGNSQGYNGQSTDRHQDQGPGNGRTEDLSGSGSLYV